MEVFSLGHSNRTLEEFAEILLAYGIQVLVDVRTLPGSDRYPHFNGEILKVELAPLGIRYVHRKALGGLRRPLKDSPNAAWRNRSFRGYADYMQTPAFSRAVDGLVPLAAKAPACLMCAEAVPWRCHRSLIADALLARGIQTLEIFSLTQNRVHRLTPWGRIRGGTVVYPLSRDRATDGVSAVV
jgi:uncharacterized protein (DUF488 family)